jgi:hypothetical protein
MWRSFQLRKERSKELAKPRKNFQVVDFQEVTPPWHAKNGPCLPVLEPRKFACCRPFLHDVKTSRKFPMGMGIGDKKAVGEQREIS